MAGSISLHKCESETVTTDQSNGLAMPVAVVSDGSGLAEPVGFELDSVLRGYARLLRQLGGPRACDILLNAYDAHELVDGLRALPAEVRAVYLVHTDASRLATVQRNLGGGSGGRLVIADQDVTAMALCAKLLTILTRRGRATATSQVVLAEGSTLPNLGPLLMAVQIFDIAFWKEADAPIFPLERVSQDADAVIDLRTEQHDDLRALGETGPAILTPKDKDFVDSIGALPGLLNVALDSPITRIDIDVYAAVAQALCTMTPPDQDFPGIDPALTDSIEWTVRQAVRHPRGT